MPVPVISGPDTVCAGQTVVYSTPFVTGNSYNWNVTGGTIVSTANNSVVVSWPAAGTGIVTVTEINTVTCDSTVTLNVNVAPQPAPTISGPPVNCTTYSSQYRVVNVVAGNTYLWSVTGGTIIGPNNLSIVDVMWTVPGTASITLNETNNLGCDSTVSMAPTVLVIPTPVLSGPDSVCQYGTITYSVPLVQGNSYTWNVTGGSVISINNNIITVQWPFTGNGTIAVTESNTSSCDSTVSIPVFINTQPTPVITGNNVSCTSTLAQYSLQSINPANTYSWNVTGGIIQGSPSANSISVLWTTAGNGSVTVTESNSYCDSTVTYPVLLLLRPAPVISGPAPVCQLDTVTYSTPFIPNHTYQWTVTNGSIIGLNVGPSIDVLWNNPGTGTVSVRQFSPDGCDSLVSRTITINPVPLPVITGPVSICENEPAIYSVSLSPGNTYNWTIVGGIINGPTNGTQISVQWNNATIGNVNITQTNNLGCRNTDYNTVTILEKPEPHIYGSSVGCLSTPGTYYSNAEPGTYYQWNVTGGSITSGNGTANVNIVWTAAGNQTITLTATDSISGCDSTITMNIVTGTMPTAVIQLPAFNGCAPLPALFNGNTEDPDIKYNWSFGDGNTSTAANPEYNFPYSGTYNVQLITSNNTGCIDTATTQVTVYPTPVSSFTMWYGTGPYYAGMNTVTFTNTSQGGSTYIWKFGDGSPSSTSFNTEHMYLYPGSYTIQLHVTNQYGCTNVSRGILEVIVPEDIYIPNAFSPNGDAHNDQFQVSAVNINDFDIKIFNRWGQLVYASTDQQFHWDGTHNGREIPQGVYVYSLTAVGYHGTRFNLYGTVTLIK
jgi:gliding motility-associated-like protein